jgi:hypothetical protein
MSSSRICCAYSDGAGAAALVVAAVAPAFEVDLVEEEEEVDVGRAGTAGFPEVVEVDATAVLLFERFV